MSQYRGDVVSHDDNPALDGVIDSITTTKQYPPNFLTILGGQQSYILSEDFSQIGVRTNAVSLSTNSKQHNVRAGHSLKIWISEIFK